MWGWAVCSGAVSGGWDVWLLLGRGAARRACSGTHARANSTNYKDVYMQDLPLFTEGGTFIVIFSYILSLGQ